MKNDVDSFVKQCTICQHSKHSLDHPAGLLQPLPIPAGVWEGFTVILVVVDRLTKYAHFIPMKHPYTTVTVAQLFMDNIVRLHGLPNSIDSFC